MRRRPILILVLLASLLLLLPASGKSAETRGSVLFIGNSYTFVNDLPAVFEAMAKAGKTPMRVESYTKGGGTLTEFLDSPAHARCRDLLAQGNFSAVVLQDQSQSPLFTPERTIDAAQRWCALAKQAEAKPVLFLTWAHAQTGEKGRAALQADMQERATTVYCKLSQETGAKLSPVGEAWRLWLKEHPDIPLHGEDGRHPNALGTYLSACALYGTLCRKSPVGLPAKLKSGKKILLQVPAKQAAAAQKTAEKTLRSFKPGDYLRQQKETDAARPSIEELRPLIRTGSALGPLEEKLGQPAAVQGNIRCYLLRGGGLMHVTVGEDGSIRRVAVVGGN